MLSLCKANSVARLLTTKAEAKALRSLQVGSHGPMGERVCVCWRATVRAGSAVGRKGTRWALDNRHGLIFRYLSCLAGHAAVAAGRCGDRDRHHHGGGNGGTVECACSGRGRGRQLGGRRRREGEEGSGPSANLGGSC